MSTEAAVVGFPIEKLTDPTDNDPYPNLLELIINGNGLSLTYHANNLIVMVTGCDLLATITNNVTGNWSSLQKSSSAIRNLSAYNGAYHEALDGAMGLSEQTWKGNAADSAREFFKTLDDALDAQVDPLNKMADDIDGFALASYHMANGLATVVQALGDLAIQWMITKAAAAAQRIAAAAAASTGVGATVAAGLMTTANILEGVAVAIAAIMATKVAKAIGDLSQWVGAAQALVGAISAGLLSALETGAIPDLPSASYDHPGVL